MCVPADDSANVGGIQGKGKDIDLLFLDEKKQKSSDCTKFAKNFLLRRKSFNSTLISNDARLITLLLIGKGVRMRASLHSSPERFIDALIIYFLNANSVMSGKKNKRDCGATLAITKK